MSQSPDYKPRYVASPFKRRRFFMLPKILRRFLFPHSHEHAEDFHKGHPWWVIIWLTGVDYFSTIAYQPGLALLAAGAFSPLATLLLLGITLFGAVPVYFQVARRSYSGQGSIAMLENMLPGWFGKIFVLTLIGFALTDFIITITLSAADATAHIIENPILSPIFGESALGITSAMLVLLAVVFMLGFTEAIRLAAFVAVPFIVLNIVVIAVSLNEIFEHQDLFQAWLNNPSFDVPWTSVALSMVLVFPRLALGLSGFETGIAVMPLIVNTRKDADIEAVSQVNASNSILKTSLSTEDIPSGRIHGTRMLLLTAACIMSVLLLGSSFCTTILIDKSLVEHGGAASGRAISYLAHKFLGRTFGTIYDVSTVAILWFAGASAFAALLSLIPRYLPRFGMAPAWVSERRPLVLLLFVISLIVTFVFKANVEAQAGAYATGVLVLILSASIAVAVVLQKESVLENRPVKRLMSMYFWVVSAIFLFTLVDNAHERPDGLIISGIFIFVIMVTSAISRALRAYELRVEQCQFLDPESAIWWEKLKGKKICLVPIGRTSPEEISHKLAFIHNYYKPTGNFAFLNVKLQNNISDFNSDLKIKIEPLPDGENFLIFVTGAVAVPNAIAYLSEELDPIAIYFGLARLNAMQQALSYLLFGSGEVGIVTYRVLVSYWEKTPEDDVRPLVFMLSE